MTQTQACEVILRWHDDRLPEYCGRPTMARYPAAGGGYMHLCEEHAAPHLKYAERIEPARAADSIEPVR